MKAENPELSISDIARQFMSENDGDVVKATQSLEDAAKSNTGLWITLTAKLLHQACYDACRQVCHAQRRAIWNTKGSTPGGHGSRVLAHAKSLMDFPLPGGKPLKNATKEECVAAATSYEKQAKTSLILSKWFFNISDALKPGEVVGATLTEDQVSNMRVS